MRIDHFNFKKDQIVADNYQILECLGKGWEGEVYKAVEMTTKIPCALKFFFPVRNVKNRVAISYAKKLHALSQCPVVVRYYSQEKIDFKDQDVTCMVFEYAEGEILSNFLDRQVGKRVGILQGLQLLHSLVSGIEALHQMNEYHGDLHAENILLKRRGLGFDFKLIDLYTWGDSKRANKAEDICNLIRIFYDAIGGKKHYAKHPVEVKGICLGLKRSLILKKFRNASLLREYIENMEWQSIYRI